METTMKNLNELLKQEYDITVNFIDNCENWRKL